MPLPADPPTPRRRTVHRAVAAEIEARWQDYWEEQGTFDAPNPTGPLADADAPARAQKLFVLDMFPYPSGAGLHVGHPLGYIGTDGYGRYQRMAAQRAARDGLRRVRPAGRAVRGADRQAPADDHRGQHRHHAPRSCAGWAWRTTRGARSRPPTSAFYRWTQWIFLQIFNSWYDDAHGPTAARPGPADRRADRRVRAGAPADAGRPGVAELAEVERRRVVDTHRLAYVSEAPVNWCPGLGTVLANEEVTADGRSERGNFPVFKRSLKQWMMRITAYADRLLDDLDRWTGRSRSS